MRANQWLLDDQAAGVVHEASKRNVITGDNGSNLNKKQQKAASHGKQNIEIDVVWSASGHSHQQDMSCDRTKKDENVCQRQPDTKGGCVKPNKHGDYADQAQHYLNGTECRESSALAVL